MLNKKNRILWFDPCGIKSVNTGGRRYNGLLYAAQAEGAKDIINSCAKDSIISSIRFLHEFLKAVQFKKNDTEKYIIIDITNVYSYLIYLVIAVFFNFKVLLIIHHLTNEEIIPNGIKSYVRKIFSVISIFFAHKIICPSKYTHAQIGRIYKLGYEKKCMIINPPIVPFVNNFQDFDSEEIRKRIVFIGRVDDSRKNVQFILDFLAELDSNVSLDLIGQYDKNSIEYNEICCKIHDKSLQSRVVFHGVLDRESISKILSKARAMVNFSEIEGYGMAAAEAICSGVPVICFNRGGLREVVVNNFTGILVEQCEPRLIADAVSHFFRDENVFLKFRENCIASKNQFLSEEQFAIKAINIF